jgi:hypothetical protein
MKTVSINVPGGTTSVYEPALLPMQGKAELEKLATQIGGPDVQKPEFDRKINVDVAGQALSGT